MPIRSYYRLWLSGFGVAATLAGCSGGPSQRAAGSDSALAAPATAPLAYLRTYVGRAPGDANLWVTEPLRTRMTRLLGGDYDLFLENLSVQRPLAEEGGLLYVTGTCPASAKRWGAALVVVDPEGDRLVLKLRSDLDGQTRTWAEGEILVLPSEVTKTLSSWEARPAPSHGPAPRRQPEETKG